MYVYMYITYYIFICIVCEQALANHSCSPTAVPTFAGSLIRLRAVRELRVGDHVTTAYLDLAEPLLARQLDLQARYFFR